MYTPTNSLLKAASFPQSFAGGSSYVPTNVTLQGTQFPRSFTTADISYGWPGCIQPGGGWIGCIQSFYSPSITATLDEEGLTFSFSVRW